MNRYTIFKLLTVGGKMLLNKNYFKGWYFKYSSGDKTIAFIPAYHRNNKQETASLQIITDDAAYNIPFDYLQYQESPLSVRIGNCIFSENGIKLNIDTQELNIYGVLKFNNLYHAKYDIMGPFRFVPLMQCRHSVQSVRHQIDGQIIINGQKYLFNKGVGYIEGDRGRSFPNHYIWTQCCFKNGSLMLSIANIPMMGFHFTGIIGFVLIGGKEYRIATYLGAKVKHIGKNSVTVKQGNFQLTAKLTEKNAHPLFAPDNGKMSRTIHESASCKSYYKFTYKNKILCEFTSDCASFEFEY